MAIKMTNSTDYFNKLQQRIDKAIAENKPYDHYVKKQIQLLKDAHDEFIATVKKDGLDINQPNIGEIEVRQYSAMKALAKKIGLPVEEYDELIKSVKIRVFGEENYKRFFEK